MVESNLVVDTNIFFSLLLRRDTALRRRFLTDTACAFHCPRFFEPQTSLGGAEDSSPTDD